jgi:hypothetical protein
MNASICVRHRVMLGTRALEQQIELPLKDARGCRPIGVVGKYYKAVASSFGTPLA